MLFIAVVWAIGGFDWGFGFRRCFIGYLLRRWFFEFGEAVDSGVLEMVSRVYRGCVVVVRFDSILDVSVVRFILEVVGLGFALGVF